MSAVSIPFLQPHEITHPPSSRVDSSCTSATSDCRYAISPHFNPPQIPYLQHFTCNGQHKCNRHPYQERPSHSNIFNIDISWSDFPTSKYMKVRLTNNTTLSEQFLTFPDEFFQFPRVLFLQDLLAPFKDPYSFFSQFIQLFVPCTFTFIKCLILQCAFPTVYESLDFLYPAEAAFKILIITCGINLKLIVPTLIINSHQEIQFIPFGLIHRLETDIT